MKSDIYTKAVLTAIAVALAGCNSKPVQIPADFAPLFVNDIKLVKDQSIQCTGRVEVALDHAILKLRGGVRGIAADSQGKQPHDSISPENRQRFGRISA
jgi:hypothetical protein